MIENTAATTTAGRASHVRFSFTFPLIGRTKDKILNRGHVHDRRVVHADFVGTGTDETIITAGTCSPRTPAPPRRHHHRHRDSLLRPPSPVSVTARCHHEQRRLRITRRSRGW
ncbi:hypothetical protein QRX50_36635 [Amycolatopsis carbonis]|uniref:Uncharacterized protein n=1 Tax=Amycolatopsis carbonis TaxID=715471 RepID=A0A9Y2IRR5_9PSEU|nr:hypothetical protein [Amycolatopsis sp. 2-15]WIX84259.1 hypothetical protein QRX50_36635 [Amycolatopsis sp. 2-15]